MNGPTASVVIPTYNRSWGLRRAVHSVLGQSFGDFELLIVDDASTDDTSETARLFADPRIRYHRQPANVGVARNWGTGVSLAGGQFVSLLMDDDRYEPEFLGRRVAALQNHPSAAFAFSGYRVLAEDGRETKVHVPACPPGAVLTSRKLLRSVLGQDCFVGATLYRTAALRAVWPAAEPAGLIVDYSANVRIAAQPGAAAVFLGGTDFVQADHPGQLTHSRADEVFREILDLYTDLLKQPLPGWARRLVRHQAAFWLVQEGRRAAARGERWNAVRQLLKAAGLHPLWRGSWTQLARVLMQLA
jgi:glycosyltransferase involved in cell wall biosynthesis